MSTLKAVANSNGDVNLSWAPPEGSLQDNYRGDMYIPDGWKRKLFNSSGFQEIVSGLKPGNIYTFQVKSMSGRESSEGINATATVCKFHSSVPIIPLACLLLLQMLLPTHTYTHKIITTNKFTMTFVILHRPYIRKLT